MSEAPEAASFQGEPRLADVAHASFGSFSRQGEAGAGRTTADDLDVRQRVPVRLAAHHRRDRFGDRLPGKGAPGRQDLVEDAAEGPDVGALVTVSSRAPAPGLM